MISLSIEGGGFFTFFKYVQPVTKRDRINVILRVLLNEEKCDTDLFFSDINNYVMHNKIYINELDHIIYSAELLI